MAKNAHCLVGMSPKIWSKFVALLRCCCSSIWIKHILRWTKTLSVNQPSFRLLKDFFLTSWINAFFLMVLGKKTLHMYINLLNIWTTVGLYNFSNWYYYNHLSRVIFKNHWGYFRNIIYIHIQANNIQCR